MFDNNKTFCREADKTEILYSGRFSLFISRIKNGILRIIY